MRVLQTAKNKDGVLYDGPYRPSAHRSQEKNLRLRHVIYRDKLSKKIFHFVCSDLKISAKTIANIYKRRWAVELLFRWLKGHLDIRRLPAKTKNAVKTMLAAAVLFQLLLQLKKNLRQIPGLSVGPTAVNPVSHHPKKSHRYWSSGWLPLELQTSC